MKLLLVTALALALAAATSSLDERFEAWAERYGKSYSTVEERTMRKSLWVDADEWVRGQNDKHAKGLSRFTAATNKFADWTAEEKSRLFGTRPGVHTGLEGFKYGNTAPATSVDWYKAGRVTSVKNQGQCGSCWAFSAIGSVEGVAAIATNHTWEQKTVTGFSEMQIVNCDQTTDDQGCNGGLITGAYQYIMKNNGLNSEEAYPYQDTQGKCDASLASVDVATITGFQNVPTKNQTAMMQAVTGQPVAVAIDANCNAWMYYQDGVLDHDCGDSLDHGVLVTGYSTEAPKYPMDGYWIVKNSWGTDWGNAGYVWMMMDPQDPEGLDGMLIQPAYAVGARMPDPYYTPQVCGKGAVCQFDTSCCCTKKGFLDSCDAFVCCKSDQTCTKYQGCS